MKKHKKSIKLVLRILFLSLCFFAIKSSSCKYDDAELRHNIQVIENRVTTLEEWKTTVNTSIASLKTVVNSLETKNFITKVEPVFEGGKEVGYKITFQSGETITIKHGIDGTDGEDGSDGKDGSNGVDGVTPVIGVAKHTDGIYYWTVNGEFLTDNNGKKMPVTGPKGEPGEDGKDGANAIAPKLRINHQCLEISIDNSQTWNK